MVEKTGNLPGVTKDMTRFRSQIHQNEGKLEGKSSVRETNAGKSAPQNYERTGTGANKKSKFDSKLKKKKKLMPQRPKP